MGFITAGNLRAPACAVATLAGLATEAARFDRATIKENRVVLRLPVTIVAITVWCYWLSVVVMILRSHLKLKSAAGAVPRTGLERWMWLIWVPTVIGWQVLPRLAYLTSLPLLRAPQWAMDHPNAVVDWLAVVAAILAYVLTVPCWVRPPFRFDRR